MFQVSNAEKTYIRDGFKLKVRSDGRANNDIREVWLENGTLSQANGSCTLYDPDASATIHIGIKLEIGEPDKYRPEEGTIRVTVDSSQRGMVSGVEKKELDEIHEDMKYLIEEFMVKPIDKKKFCHVPGKICWILNVDVFCLTLLKPIFIDKISLGIRYALTDLEIPDVSVAQNQITLEYELDIIEDRIKTIDDFIDMSKVPIITTIGEVEDCLAVDLTEDEYQCLDSKYVVSVDLKGDIHGINKLGTGGVLFEDMPRVFKLAKTTTYELLKSQNKHVSNTKTNNQQMVESL